MSGSPASIRFVVGSRQLFAVARRLVTVSLSLEQLLSDQPPLLDALPADCDGYRLLSIPAGQVDAVMARLPGFLAGGRQNYDRRYIAMQGSFENYLGAFSGKTRSTLRRKRRKLAELSGGELQIEVFTQPTAIPRFFAEALPLSRQTYQARLLDAGLPETAEFIAHSQALAAQDRLRAYLLRVAGQTVAYLYLPIEGQTLVYAHLGYAPDWAQASPGTVLQLEALERLFAEQRFGYFDFTEGDGSHKEMFATGAAPAASLFLLRPTLFNRLLIAGLDLFDLTVSGAKRVAARAGIAALVRRVLRG